jgi:small-conductance mechanosensitive channel
MTFRVLKYLTACLPFGVFLFANFLPDAQGMVWAQSGQQAKTTQGISSQGASSRSSSGTPVDGKVAAAQADPASAEVGQQLQSADGGQRSKAVIQHLNGVLRFYHDTEAPIQKIGEPSDLVYRDQALTLASQIAGLAFQSAKAEAALMAKSHMPADATGDVAKPIQTQAQKMEETRAGVMQRITALKAQDEALEKQLQTARPRNAAALQEEREQVQGELELQTAMGDALGKLTTMSEASGNTGFLAQINQLERSAPGLMTGKATSVAPTLENLTAAKSAGVTSQAQVLFQLIGTKQALATLIKDADGLHGDAVELRAPLIDLLKKTIAQGTSLAQQASPPSAVPTSPAGKATGGAAAAKAAALRDAATLAGTRNAFDALTAKFNGLASASVPLSQEIVTLEQSEAGLKAWQMAVDEEYVSILRSLLLRVGAIAISLAVIFTVGEAWRRATTRYVRDLRRRRQLLVVRRLAIGFLTGLALIFGLVTQFSSLATFAGFITAGIAVGLQTILLSVAAYFFIIGRYGVKVGDRITIAGVTGDVAEVGLVRFYVLELAGAGTDLYPSGRIAVFSNAVLFQAGTPLYKQMPGTEYLWHEMTVKLADDVDYRPAVKAMLESVNRVYQGYRPQIEKQHRAMESWMDTSLDTPNIQSSLQLVDGGLQFWARFPVLIRQTTETDDRMTEALLQTIGNDPKVKAAVSAPPVVRAAVRG